MGGQTRTAKIITDRRTDGKKVTLRHVWSWLNRDKKGIPLEYLVDIEEESGISRTLLRGDVPWVGVDSRLREVLIRQVGDTRACPHCGQTFVPNDATAKLAHKLYRELFKK